MARLPRDLATVLAVRALKRAGWQERTSKKSGAKHTVLVKSGEAAILTIPRHQTIKTGLLRALTRNAGMSVDEFIGLL